MSVHQKSVCRNILQCFGVSLLGNPVIYAILLSICFYDLSPFHSADPVLMYVILGVYILLLQSSVLHYKNTSEFRIIYVEIEIPHLH